MRSATIRPPSGPVSGSATRKREGPIRSTMSIARTAASIADDQVEQLRQRVACPGGKELELVGDDREHAQRPLMAPRALDLVLERPGGEPAAAAHLVCQGVSATSSAGSSTSAFGLRENPAASTAPRIPAVSTSVQPKRPVLPATTSPAPTAIAKPIAKIISSRNRSFPRSDRRSRLRRTGGAGMGWGVWYICYEGLRKLRPT